MRRCLWVDLSVQSSYVVYARNHCISSAVNRLSGYSPLAMTDRELQAGDESSVSNVDTDGDWLYFVASNSDGSRRLIVRRSMSGDSWGPLIELLSRDEGRIERPQLLTDSMARVISSRSPAERRALRPRRSVFPGPALLSSRLRPNPQGIWTNRPAWALARADPSDRSTPGADPHKN